MSELVLTAEADQRAVAGAKEFLTWGAWEDPDRAGLVDTPARMVRALREMTAGYQEDPAKILARTFEGEGYDEVVAVRDIDFCSLCEHHVLPFVGRAHVAYLPHRRIVGLSKIPRLVECFARRLQVQERMTNQVARAMEEHLRPRAVAVVIEASHSCLGCRGARKAAAVMTTSTMLGLFREDAAARSEVLRLLLRSGG